MPVVCAADVGGMLPLMRRYAGGMSAADAPPMRRYAGGMLPPMRRRCLRYASRYAGGMPRRSTPSERTP